MPETPAEPKEKKFQYTKNTPPDPRDGHTHMAAYDEDGYGGTSEAGTLPHVHAVFSFKAQPFYHYDQETSTEYVSVHPGSMAFAEKKKLFDIPKMEIFRIGTHNGEDFNEDDLEEIALNFYRLRNELRPVLKITHEDDQINLAGLASYGDVVDVWTEKDDNGEKRLYAKIENVPGEVIDFIKDRRFPQRSVEIYPEFKLGTRAEGKIYKNVLKAIALLGSQMPAVTGMAPVKLSSQFEDQKTICLMDICFPCQDQAIAYLEDVMKIEQDVICILNDTTFLNEKLK